MTQPSLSNLPGEGVWLPGLAGGEQGDTRDPLCRTGQSSGGGHRIPVLSGLATPLRLLGWKLGRIIQLLARRPAQSRCQNTNTDFQQDGGPIEHNVEFNEYVIQ